MTEEEAKTKWCPFARTVLAQWRGEKLHVDGPSPVHNRYTLDVGEYRIPAGAVCVGSACMAWRWERKPRHDDYPTPEADAANAGTGFCGLAGKP